jgi:hypothetical protein
MSKKKSKKSFPILSKNMEWSRPFLESVAHVVPLHKVKKITGYTVASPKKPRYEGCCYSVGNKYNITILLSTTNYKTIYLEDALTTLAHELAHLSHWKHSPSHLGETGLILSLFGLAGIEIGIKDTAKRLMRRKVS